ncbi:MAG: hypothetical protein GY765_13540 [bacterium]|nr:hypothetical protein [bacterium]
MKKGFRKKLTLNRETVACLDTHGMEDVQGGARNTFPGVTGCVLSMWICKYTDPRTESCNTFCC